jgi:hypothetical protein
MIRLIFGGLWVCIVTLAASYAAASWKMGVHAPAPDEGVHGLQSEKTQPISVPMIKDGAVQGYVVAQFAYTIDAATLKQLSVPPDVFMVDEAFRRIYSDTSLDFQHLERYDIDKLKHDLIEQTNARLKSDLIKDVLVEEFNYVTKEDALR